MLCPDGFTLVIPLVFLVSSTLCCSGRVILHLSPTYLLVSSTLSVLWPHELYTCLPLVPLVSQSALSSADVSSAYSGYTWPDVFTLISVHLSPCLYALGRTIFHLSPCLSPCLYALGRMIFHLSPCLSPFLFHLSPLVAAYSGYAWPECFYTWSRLASSPAPCLDTLGQMALHCPTCLPACLPSCYTCLHLSPCFSPLLLHLSPWAESFNILTCNVKLGLINPP